MAQIYNYNNITYGIAPARSSRFKWLAVYSAIVLAVSILQIVFGTDARILLVATATAFCGFLILSTGGLFDAISIIGFSFFFNTIFFAILLKTALGQSLDSNL
jgi:hypothetical protein